MKPGTMLLTVDTHVSLCYVAPFDDQRCIASCKAGEHHLINLRHVRKDWDRIFLKRLINLFK